MFNNTVDLIIICQNTFQSKYYQKLLENTNSQLSFYYNINELLAEIELWFTQFDLIIIDSYQNKKEIYSLISHIENNPDKLFYGFPFLFIENKGSCDEMDFFKQKGAKILKKPINSDILLSAIKDFLEPEIPVFNLHKSLDSTKKNPCIEVPRQCPICENEINLSIIDFKKTLLKNNIFFIPVTEALNGFHSMNLGDDLLTCPYCLFTTESKYDFISKTLNDSEDSFLYGREDLIKILRLNTLNRFEYFNRFYHQLEYKQKKEIGILGNENIKFQKLKNHPVFFDILFHPPKSKIIRILAFDLLILNYHTLLKETHHDDVKKVLYLKIGNSYLKKAIIKEELMNKSHINDYHEAVKYYKLLLEKGTSYHVLYRLAVIYDKLYDLKNDEFHKKETLRYLSYLYTAAHQSKHELFDNEKTKETKTKSLPKGLFRQTEDFYFELRDKIKTQ